MESRGCIARVAVLHPLLQLLILELVQIKGSRTRVLHEGHRGIDRGVEDTIVGIRDGSGVVEPSWHTHVVASPEEPICIASRSISTIRSIVKSMTITLARSTSGATLPRIAVEDDDEDEDRKGQATHASAR